MMTEFNAPDEYPEPLEELRVPRDSEHYQSSSAGGCWICHGDFDSKPGSMFFDMEFDTYYHEYCAEKVGVKNIVEYERGEWYDS